MKNRLSLGVLTVLLVSGCQTQVDDLDTFIAQVKQNTPVNIEPYPEFEAMPAFKYEASDLRSPFQRPKNQIAQLPQTAPKNCLQPDFSRSKSALESYGIDALSVSGMFTSQGKQWALLKANDGSLHQATVGDYLGLFFGRITAIENGTIQFTEMLPDGAGCWQKKQAELTMAAKAGENTNV